MQLDVHPAATDAEAAAIVAALDALWPSASGAPAPPERETTRAWRSSGRWWKRDRMSHADRPWR